MKQDDSPFLDRLAILGGFFWIMIVELWTGVKRDRIPAHRWCFPGILLGVALVCRLDQTLSLRFGQKLLARGNFRLGMVALAVTSGWWLWAFARASQRYQLLTKLRDAFESCGWKSLGRYPSLIEDAEVDSRVRRLRLKTAGVSMSEFLAGKEKFEHMMNLSVVRVLMEPGDKQRIDLLYAIKDLPTKMFLERAETYVDGELPIGFAHDGPVRINFRDVAHVLVAGQSGGGKSNFMKLAATVLSLNNPDAAVLFLDCKGGMECADLKDRLGNMRSNFSYHEGAHASAEELVNLGRELDLRLRLFGELGISSFDAYANARLAKSPLLEDRSGIREKRTYILIDEIAQVYLKDPSIDKALAMEARAAVNRIARQGRAAGFHLVAATQKPDSQSFDQTVKSNMPGVLCFPMPNQQTSISAVGTKRAYELDPNIKGRAVWKFGPKMEEVQTYCFDSGDETEQNRGELDDNSRI